MAKDRSPNYPSIGLEKAIELIAKVYQSEHTHTFAQIAALNDLGYSGPNGRALTRIGALRAYGLLEGRGDALRVTRSAVTVIEFSGEPQNPARIQALRECAFLPSVFGEMHAEFGDRPPSDAAMRYWLVDRGFLSNAADEVIKAYRENLTYLETASQGYNGSKDQDVQPPREEKPIAVGDYVQWESRGVLQFSTPRRVRDLSDDGGWAFVEGSDTGVPVKELTVEQQPETKKPPILPEFKGGGMPEPKQDTRQDVFSLVEGPVVIQWPAALSRESFEDLGAWLDILKRKIGRSVTKGVEPANA